MIRLFAALALPDEVAEGLGRRQSGLAGARWRSREALHVTLRFFGELPGALAAELDAELEHVRGDPFELRLAGVGAFGDHDRMRAVWAGVEGSAPLGQLASACEAAARRVGLKPETRAYRPHVTLAYLDRDASGPRVAAWVQAHNLMKSPPFRVEGFGLYSSWMSAHGSRYDRERDYPLHSEAPSP